MVRLISIRVYHLSILGKLFTVLKRYDDAHLMFDKANEINPLEV